VLTLSLSLSLSARIVPNLSNGRFISKFMATPVNIKERKIIDDVFFKYFVNDGQKYNFYLNAETFLRRMYAFVYF
jgi:hypothetical protein